MRKRKRERGGIAFPTQFSVSVPVLTPNEQGHPSSHACQLTLLLRVSNRVRCGSSAGPAFRGKRLKESVCTEGCSMPSSPIMAGGMRIEALRGDKDKGGEGMRGRERERNRIKAGKRRKKKEEEKK